MADDNIVPVDFGREQRESARRLARLLGILADRDADMLANPKKYFDMAAREIVAHQRFLRDLEDARRSPLNYVRVTDGPPPFPEPPQPPIMVMREDFDMWKRVEALLNRGPETTNPVSEKGGG